MADMAGTDDPRRARSRRRLLDAAGELLLSGGASAVTVEAVTTRSGVARTTLYRNFSSSDALVAAAFGELLPRATASPEGSVRDRMVDLAVRQYELLLTAPVQDSLIAWLAMGPRDEETESADELGTLRRGLAELYLAPLQELLDEAVESGACRPEDRNLAVARLIGPMIVTKLVGLEPLSRGDIIRVIDDVLAA